MGPLIARLSHGDTMAFKIIVVAAMLALANAGNIDMNMMKMMMENMAAPAPAAGNCANGNCQLPANVDVNSYIEQQKEAQKFEQQQMSAQIKAKFDAVMVEVTMKKHRYALSVMTEFTSMCACMQSSYDIYQSMFVESARIANMTDIIDMEVESQKMPYEATSMKEAKERIFGGMLYSICTALGTYMEFAQQVEQAITNLQTQG